MADIEADLGPLLEDQYGEARLMCGTTDIFAGGTLQSVLQEGNAFPCMYLSDPDGPDVVWVDLLVLMTADDTYGVHVTRELVTTVEDVMAMESQGQEFGGMLEPTGDPEWLYRDGLTCDDLARPVTDATAPGPDFEGLFANPAIVEGLAYPEVLYYFFDNDRPASMDPDGDGRPCTESFSEAEITAFYDGVRQVSGSQTSWQRTSPAVTTLDIRTAIAEAGLPPQATQVDCSLAGPVSVGSLFTCAPRLNQEPATQMVVIIEPDGSYLAVRQEVREGGPLSVPPTIYREGLSCDDLLAPVTVDTMADLGMSLEEAQEMLPELGEQGLDYPGIVLYFHLNGQPANLDVDGNGWPCEQQYPAEQISDVQHMVTSP